MDFIIVGRGLAAITLAHTFYKHKISFKIIGNETLSNCSRIAAGIWNPIVFKRLTKSWLADDLIPYLTTFYAECETVLEKNLVTQRPILKPFTEDQEKTLWIKKAKGELENFLVKDIHDLSSSPLKHYKVTNGYGIIKQSGNLNVADFLETSTCFFKEYLVDDVFDHSQLIRSDDKVTYKELNAKNIIFCEGYLVKDNPFFSWIPLKPAKGEILTIEARDLSLKNAVFNRNGFLMDTSDGIYKAGATYEWQDLTQRTTEKGLEELHSKIKQMIRCEYTLLKHEAGIRPSSIDRRPIIGAHPLYKNMHVFNGLGTKGVMLAPFFAKNFVNFYLEKEPLHKDVDINRFYQLYGKKKQD